MTAERRAIAVFTAIGVAVAAAIVVLPRLAGGAGGVAALPTVERTPPAAEPAAAQRPPGPDVPRLLQFPTVSKTQIAFTFAGQLWTVPRAGGTARRVVTGQLGNVKPMFSPDGSQIAFTAVVDGNADVYVVPSTGGEPRRLTYHPGPDVAVGWTPDGTRILMMSYRRTARDLPKLFTVAVTGGMPEELPLPSGTRGALSPDGTRLAYEPYPQWQAAWKRYRGGQTSQIWIADLADSKVTKIPRDNSNDRYPMWVDNTIYFLSDRTGQNALYAFDVGANKVREVARDPKGFDYRSASAGPGAIAVERLGQIALVDPASGAIKQVPITIADELPEVAPHLARLGPDQILHATISPTGKRVLLEAHGEILSAPVDKGSVRNLTQTPEIADRDPAWSPDGKWIAWLSDRGGEYALYFMTPDGLGPMHVVKLGDPPSFFYAPRWSPDSKKIAIADKRLNLWLIDIDHPTPVKIDNDRYDTPLSNLDPTWSPDSRWVLYDKQLPNHLHGVFIYNVDDKKSHALTDGRSDAVSPRFDRSGKYVWFLASTNVGPAAGWLDMTSDGRPVTSSVYAIVLSAKEPSPVAPESDEETPDKQPKPPEKPGGKPAAVTIDFDDIDQRIVALPIERANYVLLEAGPAGTLFLGQAPVAFDDESAVEANPEMPLPIEVSKFDLKTRKTDKFIERIDAPGGAYDGTVTLAVSADGSKMLYRAMKQWFVTGTEAPPKPGEGAVKTAGLEVWVDPRAEWRQMYHEVWRTERDFLYDPKAHGLDLAAAEKVYAPFVDGIASREDLNRLFEEMLGNLVLGHVFVNGGDTPEYPPVPVGLLGADFAIANGHYRIAKILHGENWNPKLVAPLTQPGVVVKEGDYLLAVNGRPVSTSEAVEAPFVGTAGKQTVITLAASADGHDQRKVTVVPIPFDGGLRLRDWMESNRKKVEELSKGRVGYVFIPDTAAGGFTNFNRYFFSQVDKDAVVLDERFNHGGQIADYVVEVLKRTPNLVNTAREGEEMTSPAEALFGPKVMIANQMSGSGGDALPWLFKRAKLGPLVGVRTWGGLVGIGGYPQLIDGGEITAPRWGLYSAEGTYDVENIGVAPDVEVEQDPALVRQGHDPQLERAVALALEALAKQPPKKFVRPPFPDYGPRLPHP